MIKVKVVCIDKKGKYDSGKLKNKMIGGKFTIGKVYDAHSNATKPRVGEADYYLLNDDDGQSVFSEIKKGNFVTVEEYREMQLTKIGI